MAAPDLENLLEKIKQLFFYESTKILVAKEVVEMLENSIRLFKAFLEDNPYKFQGLSYKETVRDIRKIVWETEDLIDSLVEGEDEIDYSERDTDTRKALHDVAEEAESIGAKVVRMYDKIETVDIPNSLRIHFRPAPQPDLIMKKPLVDFQVKREFVVGFKTEEKNLIQYLMEETMGIDIISIVGVPGLGKTTLAWKIFQNPTILSEFPIRIWINASSDHRRRILVWDIFRQLNPNYYKSDHYISLQELDRTVSEYLETNKSLIVMDDVPETSDLDNLISSLPSRFKMGKVLITSRRSSIRSSESVNLFFLSDRQSWLLLRYEVFGHKNCPTELEDLGKLIAKQCNGLPLAIVMMGGILAHQISSKEDMDSRRRGWSEVYQRLRILNMENPLSLLEQIVALSYDRLPYHLKACFLYLGMFPKGFEIPVLKLTLLWIAEGFIAPREGISMEETAEKYLNELIGMNLVRIDKTRIDGKAKTCRIDDIVHAFCQHEAGTDRGSIIQEMKFSSMTNSRHLYIHFDFWDFISSNPYSPQIRSFMCFSKEDNDLPSERISSILTTFKQLRVLEAETSKFSKLPSDLYHLVHLKYITLSLDSEILPSVLSNLRNVQTLIVNSKSRTLEIEADIWSMTHLRHLKTNASASLPKIRRGNQENIKGGEKLQTLGIISPQSCKEEVFDRARSLKKLSIRGRLLVLYLRRGPVSFDHLRELHNLEKLKLLNGMSDDKLPELPPPHKFPPRLRSLTLYQTCIDWDDMHILGMLENLKVLKLKDEAFVGEVWEVADGGFRRLEILKIDFTDLITWVASEHHFPNLRRLELRDCYRLKEVPVRLAKIQTFQELGLYKCTTSADTSAQLIRVRKISQANANEFKLYILK